MIKNERQYRITKAQAEKFYQALSQLRVASPPSNDLHPLLRKAEADAIGSQLQDLQTEIEDYEALLSGQRKILEVASFADLPCALIQARIAAGLTQKQLAERLGLKEQQIQQYESTEYSSASFSRLLEIVQSLGVLVREDVFLPSADVTQQKLFQRLQSIGIDRDLILKRLLPRPVAASFQSETDAPGSVVLKAASAVARVFQLRTSDLFSDAPLRLDTSAMGMARFNLPAHIDERKLSAYTIYAHYLALLALEATRHLAQEAVPDDPQSVRAAVSSRHGSVNLERALRYIWSLGIPVVPLADSASFHGACWRVDGRNVIVLAQKTRFPARWLNDGLHELRHAGQNPEEQERAILEMEDILQSRSAAEEEEDARYFAEDVTFGGRSDEIAEKCVKRAHHIEGLTRVVPQVAKEEQVPADALAYFIAYRLTDEGKNWWSAATNLQNRSEDAWAVARRLFLEYADLSVLDEAGRELLLTALTDLEA